MKANYRGFELEAHRESCMAGYPLLYYTIYQDGREWVCSFEDSAEKEKDKIKDLKGWVDDFIEHVQMKICVYCGKELDEEMFCEDCLEDYREVKLS
jgi:hypothetical protein